MAHHNHTFAGVAELADALDLGSSVLGHGGSIPFTRTLHDKHTIKFAFFAEVVQW